MSFDNTNRGNNKPKRPSNIKVEAPLVLDGYAGRRNTYNCGKAADILDKFNEDGIFKMLNVPVYVYSSDYTQDDTKKGTRVAGYIDSIAFNGDGEDPIVTAYFYPTYADMLDRMLNDGVFHIRVFVKNGDIVRINQFEYAPSSRYNNQ